ncbi:MAG: hypothetical protein IKZ61_02485 [Prevotella sp.]|nr:hypothetical protein [Prevotella sp.]
MKKILLLFTLFVVSIVAFAQTTSLEVDCQNPGWLSSKIAYSDQKTLQNLKVTGYINGTDIRFIRELNTNLSLHGIIDLEDANIVSGGDSYYSDCVTVDNQITAYMFAYLDSIQKVVLPNSTIGFSNGFEFTNTYVDTLVINGTMEQLSIGSSYNNIFWKTRCIYFPEGITDLSLGYLFHPYANLNNIELFLPSTLKKITASPYCIDVETVIHCSSTTPESIEDTNNTGQYGNYANIFRAGTIYVPMGTKAKYELSIFRNLTIIEDASTGISHNLYNQKGIQAHGGIISVSGLADGQQIAIYQVDGKQVATARAYNGSANVTTNISKGNTVIVKIGDKAVKVMMR